MLTGVATAALLLGLMATAQASTAGLYAPDPSVAGVFSLPACATPQQLDCLESVGVVDASRKYWPAAYVGESTPYERRDAFGNLEHSGTTQWSATTPAGAVAVSLALNLETPQFAHVQRSDGSLFRFGALRAFVNVADPLQTTVRFALRTSWLKPLNVGLFATDAEYLQVPIPGGSRWVFQGSGTSVSYYSSDFVAKYASNAQADGESVSFYFSIDHVGVSDAMSAYPIACADKGYTTTSANASSEGMPYWNGSTNSLDFNIGAPHTDTHGRPNFGYFKLWVPDAYVDCRWPGNTITRASNVTVQVIDEQGVAQITTTSVQRSGGRLFISAAGFHYSSPTIRVMASTESSTAASGSTSQLLPNIDIAEPVVTATPTPTPTDTATATPSPTPTSTPTPSSKPTAAVPTAPKKQTLICVKGKLRKTIVAVKPRCPAGWKAR